MSRVERDPERGRARCSQVEGARREGNTIKAAEQGYITQLARKMPDCFYPSQLGGACYFEPVTDELKRPWSPADCWRTGRRWTPTIRLRDREGDRKARGRGGSPPRPLPLVRQRRHGPREGVRRGTASRAGSRRGIGVTVAMQAMNALDQLQPVDGMGPVGEIRLVPDLDTFRVLPYAPQTGAVLTDHVAARRRRRRPSASARSSSGWRRGSPSAGSCSGRRSRTSSRSRRRSTASTCRSTPASASRRSR